MNRFFYPVLAAAFIATGCENRTNNQTPATGTTPTDRTSSTGNNSTPPAPSNTTDRPGTGAATATDAQILSILQLKDNEEVAIGQLAQQKATSDAAKQLAQRLVSDHSAHLKKVSQAADAAGVTRLDEAASKRELDRLKGATPNAADPMATLRALDGAAFDQKFGELMTNGHRDLIRLLETNRAQLKNSEVRTLVDDTLPVLREHEALAVKVQGTPGR